jgi:hypothetical protein
MIRDRAAGLQILAVLVAVVLDDDLEVLGLHLQQGVDEPCEVIVAIPRGNHY